MRVLFESLEAVDKVIIAANDLSNITVLLLPQQITKFKVRFLLLT